MVYYRKYRPQTINELDSEEVRRKLTSVLLGSAPTFLTVPHAFLFTGPKGLGKTSTARIVAKVINCTGRKDKSGKDVEPCNECDQCTSITNGSNMDIMEIDAASNRGIDEIRDLRDKIRLAPVSSLKKVYIIDEVHMLTTEAFNALLKTLEEPPSHAVFILCTTESHKVPSTVLSRCLHIGFKKATDAEIVRAFERIAKGESLSIDAEVLQEIAAMSDGGFRDGTKILEEVVALARGENITKTLFQSIYTNSGVASGLGTFFQALVEKDIQKSTQMISTFSDQGVSMEYVADQVLSQLQEKLMVQVGKDASESELSLASIVRLINLFSVAAKELKFAVVPSLPLMVAIVTWCEGVAQEVQKEKTKVEVIKEVGGETVTVATLRRHVGNMAKERAVSGEAEPKAENRPPKTDPSDVAVVNFNAEGEHTREWMDVLWRNIISEMKNHNHMIAGVLRSCRIGQFDRKNMLIEASSAFHRDKLNDTKTLSILHDVAAKLVGNPVEITIELKT
ncbi:MAG: DNA polymerase III subunit gamma/tau [Candidatus Levybacteria bacterium]|nr:DNA polymerase III subunit gamma/tau [Candidatus Levybacteria bacterium]